MSFMNRRLWPRCDKLHLIQFTVKADKNCKISSVLNFSCGGLCLIHREPIEEGSELYLKLDSDIAGKPRVMPASVKWCVPDSIGGYAIGIEYATRLDFSPIDYCASSDCGS